MTGGKQPHRRPILEPLREPIAEESTRQVGHLRQYPVDRRSRQPSDPGYLRDRRLRRLHLPDRRYLLVSDPPPPALLRAAPGLSLAACNLLTGMNALSPNLGFVLGYRRQDVGMEPPRW